MTETIVQAPVALASSVPASTPIVIAAVHKSIVASLEADLFEAETVAKAAWQNHEVLILAVGAFVLGFVAKFFI